MTLEYIEDGEGEPVVFVHGILGHRAWYGVREAVAENYTFIAYSQRYYGDQPWPDQGETFSVPTHARDLVAFVEGLDLGPVHLVTYSYGGGVGTYAALDRPDLFRSIVHFEPATFLRTIAPGERTDAANKAFVDALAPRNAAIKAGDLDEAVEQHTDAVYNMPGAFAGRLTDVQRQGLLQNKKILALQPTETPPPVTCEMLGGIDIPTLVIVGDQTWDLLRIIADRMVECMPDAEEVVLEGQTHGAPALAPDLLGAAILDFLEEQRGV